MLMSTYFILANWTDQGIKNIKASPERLQEAKRLAKAHGLTFLSFHMTLGQYDAIASVEAPNEEAIAMFALALESAGNVRTTTIKSYTEQEFREIIESLP
jgi:uncharacterized protein with GYD domain